MSVSCLQLVALPPSGQKKSKKVTDEDLQGFAGKYECICLHIMAQNQSWMNSNMNESLVYVLCWCTWNKLLKTKHQMFVLPSTWNSCWPKSVRSSLSGLQCACYIHLMCFPGRRAAKSLRRADRRSLRWCPRGRQQNKHQDFFFAVVSYTEHCPLSDFLLNWAIEAVLKSHFCQCTRWISLVCFCCNNLWSGRCFRNRLISH